MKCRGREDCSKQSASGAMAGPPAEKKPARISGAMVGSSTWCLH